MCLKCTSITTINITNCTTKFSGICTLIKVNSHHPRDEFFKTIAFMLIFVKIFITSSMSSRLMIKIKTKVALTFLTSLTSRWIMGFLSFCSSWIEVVLIQVIVVACNVVWWCPSPSNISSFKLTVIFVKFLFGANTALCFFQYKLHYLQVFLSGYDIETFYA